MWIETIQITEQLLGLMLAVKSWLSTKQTARAEPICRLLLCYNTCGPFLGWQLVSWRLPLKWSAAMATVDSKGFEVLCCSHETRQTGWATCKS